MAPLNSVSIFPPMSALIRKHHFRTSRREQTILFALAVFLSSLSASSTTDPLGRKVNVFDLIRSGEVEYHINPQQDVHDDPAEVWIVQPDGVLHVSGRGYGYVATKESFKDYYLVLEYKWGEKTWGKRENSARDNGLLLHARGPHGAYGGSWMASFECQIIEGGSGDILVLSPKLEDGTELTSSLASEFETRGKARVWTKGAPRQTVTKGRIDWKKRDPDWSDKKGFRGSDDLEKPVGESTGRNATRTGRTRKASEAKTIWKNQSANGIAWRLSPEVTHCVISLTALSLTKPSK